MDKVSGWLDLRHHRHRFCARCLAAVTRNHVLAAEALCDPRCSALGPHSCCAQALRVQRRRYCAALPARRPSKSRASPEDRASTQGFVMSEAMEVQ